MSLYLLHILTFINSTIRLLGECEKDDTGWWLRIYYIAYYYNRKIRRYKESYKKTMKLTI